MVLSREELLSYLQCPRTFAIVGASTNPNKAGNYVPKFLMDRGWKIIPINPNADAIHGIETLDSLDELNQNVDGVLIYRAMPHTKEFVKKAVELEIPLIWLPEGVIYPDGEAIAENEGLNYVEDKCPKNLIERNNIPQADC